MKVQVKRTSKGYSFLSQKDNQKKISKKQKKETDKLCVKLPLFHITHNFFKNSFFSSAIIEWNNLIYLFEIPKV